MRIFNCLIYFDFLLGGVSCFRFFLGGLGIVFLDKSEESKWTIVAIASMTVFADNNVDRIDSIDSIDSYDCYLCYRR